MTGAIGVRRLAVLALGVLGAMEARDDAAVSYLDNVLAAGGDTAGQQLGECAVPFICVGYFGRDSPTSRLFLSRMVDRHRSRRGCARALFPRQAVDAQLRRCLHSRRTEGCGDGGRYGGGRGGAAVLAGTRTACAFASFTRPVSQTVTPVLVKQLRVEMLGQVTVHSAALVAAWMAVGLAHGVMNTCGIYHNKN